MSSVEIAAGTVLGAMRAGMWTIKGELQAYNTEMIGSLASNGSSTSAVVSDGNVPTELWSELVDEPLA